MKDRLWQSCASEARCRRVWHRRHPIGALPLSYDLPHIRPFYVSNGEGPICTTVALALENTDPAGGVAGGAVAAAFLFLLRHPQP